MKQNKNNEIEITEEEKDVLRLQQNLPMGVIVGLIAAIVAALLWCAVTVITKFQIGYMAIAVGFIVGFAIKKAGKGIDPIFGVCGAVLALLGCLLGNLSSTVAFVSFEYGVPFAEVLKGIDGQSVFSIMKETFHPMDLLFYGIAVVTGYKYSMVKTTRPAAITMNDEL